LKDKLINLNCTGKARIQQENTAGKVNLKDYLRGYINNSGHDQMLIETTWMIDI